MKKKPSSVVTADQLRGEIDGDAEWLSQQLFGEHIDSVRMSQRAYEEFVARNWAQPAFRQALLVRIGAEEFMKVAKVVDPATTAAVEGQGEMNGTR